MKITDMTDREQIANELKERLRWLEDNTVDEEYNIREAAAIKQLLRIMEPAEPDWDAAYFEPASAEQRFWDTYETRVDIEQEKEKMLTGRLDMEPDLSENILLKTEEGEKKPAQPQKKNLFLYFATHRWAAAAWIAAVLTVVILASGTVGAYAQSQGGIFHFFKNNEEGMKGIVAPNEAENVSKDVNSYKIYKSIYELPVEYVENFCFSSTLCSIYNADSIKVLDYHSFVLYETQYFALDSNKYILCSQKHFINQITYIGRVNDAYTFDGDEIVDGIKIKYYINKNGEDSIYVAFFNISKDSFLICGNVGTEEIKEATREVIQKYNEK